MAANRAGNTGRTAIVWFRQDLRLADNPALAAAASGNVLPVYILDDGAAGDWKMGGAHRWWLHGSLTSLAADLAERGAPLVLRRGDAAKIIPELVRAAGADTVHAGLLMEPWARRQDEAVAAALPDGVKLEHHRAGTLFDPGAVRTRTGGTYGIYTPFAKAARALGNPPEPVAAPRQLHPAKAGQSDKLSDWGLLPTKPDWAGGLRDTWQPGEASAAKRLAWFMEHGLADYDGGRNIPGEDLTSMLSPHMHWGELSPAQAWHAALVCPASASRDRYLAELLWHEFAAHCLWHRPQVPDAAQRPEFDRLGWRKDAAGLRAWQQGRTGVPIVDAGMRQLWQTGWMHNRARMITGSFLVKHLLISWWEGERWFWDTLVDGDLAVNAQSWQWVAGCGTDSSPFFRVFNPVTQGEKFDRGGQYVRRWVPELARLPDKHLHAPWQAPASVLADAGVVLGKTYPHPVVGLEEGRDRALAAFRSMRKVA